MLGLGNATLGLGNAMPGMKNAILRIGEAMPGMGNAILLLPDSCPAAGTHPAGSAEDAKGWVGAMPTLGLGLHLHPAAEQAAARGTGELGNWGGLVSWSLRWLEVSVAGPSRISPKFPSNSSL